MIRQLGVVRRSSPKVVPESNRTRRSSTGQEVDAQQRDVTDVLPDCASPDGGHEGRDRLQRFERINRLRDVQLIPGGENAQAILRACKRGKRGPPQRR
jgi:hypothetical protein